MSNRCWVVNASPLILLGKAGYLELLTRLVETIVVPQAVLQEISAKDDQAASWDLLTSDQGFRIERNLRVPADLLAWDLGAGETQVIAVAMEQDIEQVVLDDREARRCAQAMGLRVIGTLGLTARAKRIGLIEHAAPAIKRLRETGLYITDELVSQILHEIGE